LEIEREHTVVTELVQPALRAAADRFRLKGVALRSDIPPHVSVLADPGRMGQVLGNLLDNALRHTTTGGIVTVSCRAVGQWVHVDVSDTGDGIAAEHLEHVFDRFYRADPARRTAGSTSGSRGGSGIGLTISRAIVEAHGGRITAQSAGRGQGSTFTIRIPRD
jgi:signal transduction histidine kinase